MAGKLSTHDVAQQRLAFCHSIGIAALPTGLFDQSLGLEFSDCAVWLNDHAGSSR